MEIELLRKRHLRRQNSLAEQSSEDKAFFMSAPDLQVYFDHKESKLASERTSKQHELPNEPLDSWVLLAASVVYNIIMGYHFLCFGMYYVKITETFETTKAAAGFINSLHGAIGPLSGLVASALIDKYGERKVSIVGNCLVVLGIFISTFVPNVYCLYFTYGAVTGLGVSCSMLGLSISIQKHFTKHRSLATSLVYCGIPMGNLFSPMITNYFLDTYGLRGTFLLHSGIMMNVLALSGTFWPAVHKFPQNINNGEASNQANRTPGKGTTGKTSSGNSVICDVSLCRNSLFLLFITSVALVRFNTSAFFDHTPSRAVYMGYGLKWGGFLMTALCTSSLIARLTFSAVTVFYQQINPLLVLAVCAGTQGASSCLVPLASSSYSLLMVCSGIFGAAQGLMVPMILLSTVQLAGVSKFGKARALTNLFCAFSNFTATPLTGWIFDVTQNYDLPFYIAGSIALIGSSIAFLMTVIDYCQTADSNKGIPNVYQESDKHAVKDTRIRTFTY